MTGIWNRESGIWKWNRFLLIPVSSFLILLAACTQPSTQTPRISQMEYQQEAARQQQLAKAQFNAKEYSSAQIAQFQRQLQHVANQLKPEAQQMCMELRSDPRYCDMSIEISTENNTPNAFADGQRIVINAAMIDFTNGNNEELALVLAHEYTHHFMGHVTSTRNNVALGTLGGLIGDVLASSQGINTQGQFAKLGGQAGLLRYSPSFEQEADYVALYILERAGFDISDAPLFWRKMAQINPDAIRHRSTHPTSPERFVLLEKTVAEINAKKAAGKKLVPNMLPQE